MFFSHVFLLFYKNLIVLWRSKLWLVFEFLFPLLIFPIENIITNLANTEHLEPVPFEAIRILGNETDVDSKNSFLARIWNGCYDKNRAIVMYAYNSSISFDNIDYMLKHFEKMYPKKIKLLQMRSEEEISEELKSTSKEQSNVYCSKYVAAIYFNQIDQKGLDYKFVHLSDRDTDWRTKEQWPEEGVFSRSSDLFPIPKEPKYWNDGILTFQYALNNIYSSKFTPEVKLPLLKLQRVPLPRYLTNNLLLFLAFIPAIWSMSFLIMIIHSVREIVSEKETKMKAYLQVNGVKPLAWYLSNFILSFIKITFVIVILSIPILVILEETSVLLFYVVIISYGFGAIAFSMLISSLVKTTTTGIYVSLITWGALVLVANVALFLAKRINVLKCFLCALNINAAFNYAIKAIIDAEASSKPLSFWSIFYTDTQYFSIGNAIFMMLFDGYLMLFLTLMLDAMFPRDDSPPQTFLEFVCTYLPKEKCQQVNYDNVDSSENVSTIEPVREMENISSSYEDIPLKVNNLTKVWESTKETAVDDVSFEMKKGKITVLLGHNGAGKSTIFSMLVGITAPTKGAIQVYDKRLFGNYGNLLDLRQKIGYCPQSNPIFEKLTVSEQLKFIVNLRAGVFKNICGELNEHSDKQLIGYLTKLKIFDKAYEYCTNLSGGMLRKLCVCMALSGDCEIILLDECTAGMSIDARQDITSVLNEEKKTKAIMLSTHYMDEADATGDRILIMAKGHLICDASPTYLKKKYGTGYQLTIVSIDPENPLKGKIRNEVTKIIPNAEIDTKEHAGQFFIILPIEEKFKFAELFDMLDARSYELGISSYGLSLNTLEQVFLKASEIATKDDEVENMDQTDAANGYATLLCDDDVKGKFSGCCLLWQQMKGLFKKQLYYYKYNWMAVLPQIIFVLLVFVMLQLFMYKSGDWGFKDRVISSSPGELAPIKVPMQDLSGGKDDTLQRFGEYYNSFKGFNVIKRPPNENISDYLISKALVEPPFGIGTVNVGVNISMLFNGNAYHSVFMAVNTFFNVLLRKDYNQIKTSLTIVFPSMNFIPTTEMKATLTIPFIFISFNLLICSFVNILVDERRYKFKHQQLLTKLSLVTYWTGFIAFDLIAYLFLCLFYLIAILIVGVYQNQLCALLILWLAYFFSVLPFVFCLSFLFGTPTKAYVLMIIVQLIAPAIAYLTLGLVQLFSPSAFGPFTTNIINLLLPSYTIAKGMISLSKLKDAEGIYDWENGIGKMLVTLLISGLIYTFVLFIIQWKKIEILFNEVWNCIYARIYRIDMHNESVISNDNDVRNEVSWLENENENDLALVVRDLNKYYGKLKAVDNLTFGIKKGDCCGLLGVNGSGKTTTFNITTGTDLATTGTAKILGRNVLDSPTIGYCPQFDAMLPDLTPSETLTVLTQINGFKNYVDRAQKSIQSVDMESSRNKQIKYLSGGQKRKISLSIAVIANSGMIFLDEPTAGIDPKSRRSIWNFLVAVRSQQQAILLTSHSMDEVEALCSKIAFINKGKLIHIGTSQHLKSRYGADYILEIVLDNPSVVTFGEIDTKLTNDLGCAPADIHVASNSLQWKVPKSSVKTWGYVYRYMEKLNQEFPSRGIKSPQSSPINEPAPMLFSMEEKPSIRDFFITQNSLEQVFLSLSAAVEEVHHNT
uniref:ABC transporter domain-containing protein n=1 Tax=Rhabditophanes sp. KR3021 TaxID=114890 RepID=A0AC35TYD8_9BILA